MIPLWYLTLAGIASTPNIPVHISPKDVDVGNLDKVLADSIASIGAYKASYVGPNDYGSYNYCNMPHVRASEYIVPSPEYELKYVEVIQRHHKRTPYQSNTFPREDTSLSCSSVHNFYFGQNSNFPDQNVEIGWSNYQDPINPFANGNSGFNGTCQFPQISDGGLNDSYYHGVDLYQNYFNIMKFLPQNYDLSLVQYYVTSNVITSQVAGALVAGMYPPHENSEKVIVNIQRSDVDSLEPRYRCKGADNTKEGIFREAEWMEHLNRSQYLFHELDAISGVSRTDESWHTSWDHYFDNLSHRLCHDLALPCNIEGGGCITEAQAAKVFRLGDFEYHYLYRKSPRSMLYSTARYGVFLMQLKNHLEESKEKRSPMLYRHNIAHDGSISPLLGALQIDELRWPGMGAEVVFELWERNGQSYIRVLYGGQPLTSSGPLGKMDMVPYDKFVAYLDALVGEKNVVALCNL